jgi:hypothetical protein
MKFKRANEKEGQREKEGMGDCWKSESLQVLVTEYPTDHSKRHLMLSGEHTSQSLHWRTK